MVFWNKTQSFDEVKSYLKFRIVLIEIMTAFALHVVNEAFFPVEIAAINLHIGEDLLDAFCNSRFIINYQNLRTLAALIHLRLDQATHLRVGVGLLVRKQAVAGREGI